MSLVKEEREAIVDFNLQTITQTSRRKNNLLLKLRALESAKVVCTQKIASSLGLKGSPRISEIIRHIDDPEMAQALESKISCVKSLAQAAQEVNEIQRLYVLSSLNGVQSSLAILGQFQADGLSYNKKAELAGKSKVTMRGVMDQSV